MTIAAFRFKSCRHPATRMATLTACVFAATMGAAGAGTTITDAPSVVVRYGDLDLSSEQGTLALYRRIEVAARRVCPEPSRELASFAISNACRKSAIERAVRDLNNPQVAAVHAAHSGHG